MKKWNIKHENQQIAREAYNIQDNTQQTFKTIDCNKVETSHVFQFL